MTFSQSQTKKKSTSCTIYLFILIKKLLSARVNCLVWFRAPTASSPTLHLCPKTEQPHHAGSVPTFIFAVWGWVAVDFLHEVVRYFRGQPPRLLGRLSIAGVRRAGSQRLTVRENVSDEEWRGHGPLLRPRRYLRVLEVGRQSYVTLPLGYLFHALSPRRRRRRTAALRVWSRTKLQRWTALPRQTVPLGHRASRPVGQQRVDAKIGAIGGRLHCLDEASSNYHLVLGEVLFFREKWGCFRLSWSWRSETTHLPAESKMFLESLKIKQVHPYFQFL